MRQTRPPIPLPDADTMRFRRRLEKNFNGAVVDDLRERFPELRSPAGLEAFKRKWLYMFVYAEVGYARAYTSLNCWTFARPVSLSSPLWPHLSVADSAVGKCGHPVRVIGTAFWFRECPR